MNRMVPVKVSWVPASKADTDAWIEFLADKIVERWEKDQKATRELTVVKGGRGGDPGRGQRPGSEGE